MTTGVVIKVHRHKSGKSSPSYYPEFSYTANGISYNERSVIGTPRPRFTEGQKITVFYNPANPEDFYVAEDGLSNSVFYVFLVVGILLLILALFMPSIYNH